MSLVHELETERKNIKTDSYSMSFGEIINLYNEGDLKLDPAYQRLFRWDDEQKSKFIESILIGIPIPEVFVAQKQDGKWSVVDGVQRLSTLLQLTGDLPGKEPLVLTATRYLPSLEGETWETLPVDIKRIIRRSKLNINIILTENSIQSQYELFQRLNTGGIHLEPQEIRNCLIIMLDEGFFNALNKSKKKDEFIKCINLTESKLEIEYHMELIVRYLIAKINITDYSKYQLSKINIDYFIDAEVTNLIQSEEIDLDAEIKIFERTIDVLYSKLGDNAFKKYDDELGLFSGGFSLSCFEAILPGLASNIERYECMDDHIFKSKIISIYKEEDFLEATNRGARVINRFKKLSELSLRWFNE